MATSSTTGRTRKISVGASTPRTLGIGVVGIGGGGSNIVSHLCAQDIEEVDFFAINTDKQALDKLDDGLETIQIGSRICNGEGAGGDPEVGRSAAQENTQLLMSKFKDCRLLFIVSCMGGGTGTGASPVIADHAIHENSGMLTIAILTTPDGGAGDRTVAVAQDGLRTMRDHVDAMLVVPNNIPGVGMRKRHRQVNQLIFEKINAISKLLVDTQVPNVDMADLKATLSRENGQAVDMFIGNATLEPDEKPTEFEGEADDQSRFKGLLSKALASDWLTIDFDAPIEEGRGLLSFTLGGEEDDDEIDDITDESSIKQFVETKQVGAKTSNLKVASFVDSKLAKGAMKATVILRASHRNQNASDSSEAISEPATHSPELKEVAFDPSSLPTNREVNDLDEGVEDFESFLDGQDDPKEGTPPPDFSENVNANTELTRKNPS